MLNNRYKIQTIRTCLWTWQGAVLHIDYKAIDPCALAYVVVDWPADSVFPAVWLWAEESDRVWARPGAISIRKAVCGQILCNWCFRQGTAVHYIDPPVFVIRMGFPFSCSLADWTQDYLFLRVLSGIQVAVGGRLWGDFVHLLGPSSEYFWLQLYILLFPMEEEKGNLSLHDIHFHLQLVWSQHGSHPCNSRVCFDIHLKKDVYFKMKHWISVFVHDVAAPIVLETWF